MPCSVCDLGEVSENFQSSTENECLKGVVLFNGNLFGSISVDYSVVKIEMLLG